jgi:hypothetical protein
VREIFQKAVELGGTISGEHVHEIESVMAKVPHGAPSEDVDLAVQILSEAATELAPADLRKVGQRLLAHLDPDGSLTDDKDRRRMRGIIIGRQDKQEMSKISGFITPALRAKLEVLLDNWAKPGMNNPDDENPLSGSAAELSDEDRERLTEAIRTDQRSAAQRNHDAFEKGLDWILGHEALGQPNRIPVHVVVTMDERDLARHAGGHRRPLRPGHRFIHVLDLPDREADDEFACFGERPVDDRGLFPVEDEALGLRAALQARSRHEDAGLDELFSKLVHRRERLQHFGRRRPVHFGAFSGFV